MADVNVGASNYCQLVQEFLEAYSKIDFSSTSKTAKSGFSTMGLKAALRMS